MREPHFYDIESLVVNLVVLVWRTSRVPHTFKVVQGRKSIVYSDIWNLSQYPLWSHQLQSVSWMMEMETNMKLGFSVGHNLKVSQSWFLDIERGATHRKQRFKKKCMDREDCAATAWGLERQQLRCFWWYKR